MPDLPPLFVIVFDILLVSLKKKHSPQDLSGFMDDLRMVLQKAETINSQVGVCSLVINSTMSNPRGASSNPSFSILWKIFLVL